MRARIEVSLLLPVALLLPLPDVVMPGQRRVANELVFAPSPELEATQLVAAPVRGLHGIERISAGKAVPFSGKYGTRLYALPAGAPLPADGDIEALARWPSAPPPAAALWSVPAARPVAKVVTTCRFGGVRDGRPMVEVLGQQALDAAGRPVDETLLRAVLLGMAAVGAFGLWRAARARAAAGVP